MTTPTLNLILEDDTLQALNDAGVAEQVERGAADVTGGPGTISPAAVVNVTQGKEYDEIQAAVGDANEDDTIEVKSGTYDSVSIDVEGLTLESADGPEETTMVGQVTTTAADVEVSGFTVTNPEGDTGMRATDDATGVVIEDNIVTEVNTENDADRARGIIVGGLDDGDSADGLEIRDNTVTNIEGAAADERQVHAIQILEESGSGGLIENVVVDGNSIDDILDTRSTVAVNFNGNIEGEITDNDISGLNTEGETDAGDPGGFTQVIALNAGGNASSGPQNVEIAGNEISDIETTTEDNWAPAYHLIVSESADANTIDINSNEFSGDSTDDEEVYLGDGTGDLDLGDVLSSNDFDPEGQIEGDAIVRPFSENPFLLDAQTDKGGLFANVGGGTVVPIEEGTKMSDFPTGDGEPFGLDGQFMQPVYANTTDESISIEVDSIGFDPDEQQLGADPYNETEFGVDDQWYRIPTGIGTPYPISGTTTAWDEDGNWQGEPISGGPDGDYELVEISETEDGFKVVWEYLGDTLATASSTGVEQPPEDDAEAYVTGE